MLNALAYSLLTSAALGAEKPPVDHCVERIPEFQQALSDRVDFLINRLPTLGDDPGTPPVSLPSLVVTVSPAEGKEACLVNFQFSSADLAKSEAALATSGPSAQVDWLAKNFEAHTMGMAYQAGTRNWVFTAWDRRLYMKPDANETRQMRSQQYSKMKGLPSSTPQLDMYTVSFDKTGSTNYANQQCFGEGSVTCVTHIENLFMPPDERIKYTVFPFQEGDDAQQISNLIAKLAAIPLPENYFPVIHFANQKFVFTNCSFSPHEGKIEGTCWAAPWQSPGL